MLPSRIVTVGGGGFRDITERFDDCRPPGAGLAINEMMTMMSDGGAVVSVTIAEVVVRKMVYADGRFHVQIEEGRDRIAFAGSEGRASLTYGAETVSFVPDADPRRLGPCPGNNGRRPKSSRRFVDSPSGSDERREKPHPPRASA